MWSLNKYLPQFNDVEYVKSLVGKRLKITSGETKWVGIVEALSYDEDYEEHYLEIGGGDVAISEIEVLEELVESNYKLIPEEKIFQCCGSCHFIRYKTGKPTCKLLGGDCCVFGFCDGWKKSELIGE